MFSDSLSDFEIREWVAEIPDLSCTLDRPGIHFSIICISDSLFICVAELFVGSGSLNDAGGLEKGVTVYHSL